jgi:hypothetical protein
MNKTFKSNFFSVETKKVMMICLICIWVLQLTAQQLIPFEETTNYVKKYGYKDKNGKIIIPAKFDKAGKFIDGLGYVQMGGKYGFIDSTGKDLMKGYVL